MKWALPAALLLFAACAALPAKQRFAAMPLLSPASLGVEASRAQRLTIGRPGGGAALSLDAVVEVGPDAIRLAGLLAGQRVLRLEWDGRHLEESRDAVVPASLQGQGIIRDLQLVYWPADAVRSALPSGCRLEESTGGRQFYCGRTLVFEVARTDDSVLGAARFENHLGHYVISIESAP